MRGDRSLAQELRAGVVIGSLPLSRPICEPTIWRSYNDLTGKRWQENRCATCPLVAVCDDLLAGRVASDWFWAPTKGGMKITRSNALYVFAGVWIEIDLRHLFFSLFAR